MSYKFNSTLPAKHRNLSLEGMQNDVTFIPFLLWIWQNVGDPQRSLNTAQDLVRDSDTI